MTNAFDWMAYTDEERAKRGDPFKKLAVNDRVSKQVTINVKRLQDKNPYHGTIIGLSDKADKMIFADKRRKINRSL